MIKSSEILAPVATLEMCQAAVHNGANAIYVGSPGFNARGRTQDFTITDLAEIINFCHDYDVKVYIALNILIFEAELQSMTQYLKELMALAPDAFIVQDIGLVNLIKKIYPNQEVHASTQMTITSPHAINLTADLDMTRYVLARELSLEEIKTVKENTSKELEVFIHGALCVSYSGQCLTSESFGGRSANRGQCAQSCRLDYQLFSNGHEVPLNGRNFLFSPKDLCAGRDVLELQKMGVESLKIEGRLKTPQYVAATVSLYKNILAQPKLDNYDLTALQNISALQYSRGHFTGWLHGSDHQKLVDGYNNEHRGILIGSACKVHSDKQRFIDIKLIRDIDLKTGDGLLFSNNFPRVEVGSRIFNIEKHKHFIRLAFKNDFPYKQVQPGFEVYLNDSPDVEKELKRSWSDKSKWIKLPIKAVVTANIGQPLQLQLSYENFQIVVTSDQNIEAAKNKSLDFSSLYKVISSLRDTPFSLSSDDLTFSAPKAVFISNKELRLLKQKAIGELLELRRDRYKIINSNFKSYEFKTPPTTVSDPLNKPESIKFNLLVREAEQLDGLEGLPLDTVYLDYEWGQRYKQSIEKIRSMGFKAGMTSLRIHKPHEDYLLKMVKNLNPDVFLARNLSAVEFFKDQNEIEIIGDHGLNICNSLTSKWFLEKNLSRYTPSYDLNQQQLNQLLEALEPDQRSKTEVVIHHYMPAYHMEHCVFASFLSDGKNYPSCGKPCTNQKLEIKDHKGEQHYLKSDQNCRNTMYRGSPQSAAKLIPELLINNVNNFRMELLWEKPHEIKRKVLLYHDILSGKAHADDLVKELNIEEKYGVTEGQLFNDTEYKAKKKLSH